MTGVFLSAPVPPSLTQARGAHGSPGFQGQLHQQGTSKLVLSESLEPFLPSSVRLGLWSLAQLQETVGELLVLSSVNLREPGKDL